MRGRDAGLRLSTSYDDVVHPRPLPVSFTRGDDPAVQLIDGFVRGRQSLGRFAVATGLVGFRVAADARPVRVTVQLRADEVSAKYWTGRVAEPLGVAGDPSAPRVLQLKSQGRVRGAVLLCRAPWAAEGTPVRGALRFGLAPEELPADGLLLIEVADAPGLAVGEGSPLLPHAAVGVEPTEVAVETAGMAQPPPRGTLDAVTAERHGWLATGDLPPQEGVGARTVRSGVFLLDLPAQDRRPGAVTVSLSPRNQPAATTGKAGWRTPSVGATLHAKAVSMIDGSAVGTELSTKGDSTRLTVCGPVPGAVRVHLAGAEASNWNITTVTGYDG
ncbi:MAG: hypothetical protein ABJC62_04935 [Frankiaceae bacterium]